MGNFIYYCLIIIIPTILVLFNLSNVVYTIGEFKEQTSKVPKFLVVLLIKMVALSILLLHSFHYIFVNEILANYFGLSIILSLYVCLEMIITYKMLINYRKNLKTEKSEGKLISTILESTKKLLFKNTLIVGITLLIEFCLLNGIIINVMMYHNKFNISMLLISGIIIFVEYLDKKTFKFY